VFTADTNRALSLNGWPCCSGLNVSLASPPAGMTPSSWVAPVTRSGAKRCPAPGHERLLCAAENGAPLLVRGAVSSSNQRNCATRAIIPVHRASDMPPIKIIAALVETRREVTPRRRRRSASCKAEKE
jgi:hypothetical protein